MIAEEKQHGQTYTPEHVSKFLTRWAVRSQDDLILEPSVGEGKFVFDAQERLEQLGANIEQSKRLIHGMDIDSEAISLLQSRADSELEGEFPEDSDFPQTLRRVEVAFDDAQRLVHAWAQEECDLVTVSFDAAGQVEIELEDKMPWEKERTKEEVKEQLREMDELPNKARWPLVREICDAPPGTPHAEFPGGIKKTVRHAFMEVREERKDE